VCWVQSWNAQKAIISEEKEEIQRGIQSILEFKNGGLWGGRKKGKKIIQVMQQWHNGKGGRMDNRKDLPYSAEYPKEPIGRYHPDEKGKRRGEICTL